MTINFIWAVVISALVYMASFKINAKSPVVNALSFAFLVSFALISLLSSLCPSLLGECVVVKEEDNKENLSLVKTGENYIFKSSEGVQFSYEDETGKKERHPIDLNLTTVNVIEENEVRNIEVNHKKIYKRVEFLCFHGFNSPEIEDHFVISIPESELGNLIDLTK